jgi:hypothetical protein
MYQRVSATQSRRRFMAPGWAGLLSIQYPTPEKHVHGGQHQRTMSSRWWSDCAIAVIDGMMPFCFPPYRNCRSTTHLSEVIYSQSVEIEASYRNVEGLMRSYKLNTDRPYQDIPDKQFPTIAAMIWYRQVRCTQ